MKSASHIPSDTELRQRRPGGSVEPSIDQGVVSSPGTETSSNPRIIGGGGDSMMNMSEKIDVVYKHTNTTYYAAFAIGLFAIIVLVLAAVSVNETQNLSGIKSASDQVAAALMLGTPGLAPGSPSTWLQISAIREVPSPRLAHAATALNNRDRMIVHGGFYGLTAGGYALSDLWLFVESSSSWTQLYATGDVPSARLHHSLVDANDGRTLLMFGGFNNFQGQSGHHSYNELYKYDVADNKFTLVTDSMLKDGGASKPPARGAHSAIWLNGAMWVFGGFPVIGATNQMNDLWKFSLKDMQWTNMTDPNPSDATWPDGRIGGAFSPIDGTRATMFAGGATIASVDGSESKQGQLDDTWIFYSNNATFQRVNTTGARPDARRATNSDLSAFGLVFMFGGVYINGTTKTQLYDDLWVLSTLVDPPRWMQLFPNYLLGQRPPPTFGHSVVRLGNKLLLFGGRQWSTTNPGSNALWSYAIVKPI